MKCTQQKFIYNSYNFLFWFILIYCCNIFGLNFLYSSFRCEFSIIGVIEGGLLVSIVTFIVTFLILGFVSEFYDLPILSLDGWLSQNLSIFPAILGGVLSTIVFWYSYPIVGKTYLTYNLIA